MVPEGSSSTTFSIATSVVDRDTDVSIHATATERTVSGTLSVWALLQTFVALSGEPGDPILNGEIRHFTPDNARISAACSRNIIHVEAISSLPTTPNGLDNWTAMFASPPNTPLRVGTYVSGSFTNGSSGQYELSISGRGLGCNSAVGQFVVHDIELGAGGEVKRLWVTFERRCNSSSGTLSGDIRLTNPQIGPSAHVSCLR